MNNKLKYKKLRDAQGNVMATYEKKTYNNTEQIFLSEQHIYGSSRLGMRKSNDGTAFEKQYELTNHLGNVLAVVSDTKNTDGTANILSANDYYPFGMMMPGRKFNSSEYRYGFNGKENDNEVKGTGNQIDYGMRIHDPRLARFLSVDPLFKEFVWNSSYAYAENEPIANIDMDGLEKVKYYSPNGNGTINFSGIETKEGVENLLDEHSNALHGNITVEEIMQNGNDNEIWEVSNIISQDHENIGTRVTKYSNEAAYDAGDYFDSGVRRVWWQSALNFFQPGKSDPANQGEPVDLIGIEASAGGGSIMAGYIEGDGGFVNASLDVSAGQSAPSIKLVLGKYSGDKKASSESLSGVSVSAEVGYGLTVGGSADISKKGVGENWFYWNYVWSGCKWRRYCYFSTAN